MARLKFAQVLLEDTRQFYAAPSLYYRADALITQEANPVLNGPGSFDFTTFFNALSAEKLLRYTVAQSFHLHLELKGSAGTYVQTRADGFSFYSEPVEETRFSFAEGDWQVFDIDLHVTDRDILIGFILDVEGRVEIRNSYYSVEADEELMQPVELALATTTFRKEEFIERNIALVKERILGSDEPIADHFHMHVIDNGRTLDAEGLSEGAVRVYPNENVGGAGGFARGMIAAMDQDPTATHVLLMDDDVSVSPESIVRTFNLLRIVKDEYSGAFISGAMMDFDKCGSRWEDLGFLTFNGDCSPLKIPREMGHLQYIVENELFEADTEGYGDTSQQYAAWWYCCIPMKVIRENGLPLPIFVRYDDIEYSLRCRPPFITMNGICVWHLSFHLRYNAAVERYQIMRNCFIARHGSDIAPLSDFLVELKHQVDIELQKFNYTDAELALEGFEDFLKGPSFIERKGQAEESYLAALKNREKLVPLDDLREQALRDYGVDVDAWPYARLMRDKPLKGGAIDRVRWKRKLGKTQNGQLGGLAPMYGHNVAVIDAAGWRYSMGDIYGVDAIIAIDGPSRTGIIRTKDPERCRRIVKRFKDDMAEYKRRSGELDREYKEARKHLTSVEFWREYLDLNE